MILLEKLKEKRIIAGVRDLKDIPFALQKKVKVIFLLTGDIFDLLDIKKKLNNLEVMIFPHVDLVKGIARDSVGMRFLKRKVGIDGILTTHGELVNSAREEGLIAIQRLFLLDSEALKTGIKVIKKNRPHAVEIMPGIILPYLKKELESFSFFPVIAGGFVRTCEEVERIISAGAVGVSTSRKELWNME